MARRAFSSYSQLFPTGEPARVVVKMLEHACHCVPELSCGREMVGYVSWDSFPAFTLKPFINFLPCGLDYSIHSET